MYLVTADRLIAFQKMEKYFILLEFDLVIQFLISSNLCCVPKMSRMMIASVPA